MARVIVLDSGPLIDLSRPRGDAEGNRARNRLADLLAGGALVAVPEIADYEVRRGLMHARHARLRTGRDFGDSAGLRRLNRLRADLTFIPLTTAAMLWAADAWGRLYSRGLGADDRKALGADSIVAGQAATAFGAKDVVEVATGNVDHLGRFPGIVAIDWASIS